MSSQHIAQMAANTQSNWLRNYYFTRAVFAGVWVAVAFTLGRHSPLLTAALVILYPIYDAVANWIDASRTGGLARNKSQAFNLAVSLLTAAAIAVALTSGMRAVVTVFGVWAIFAGLLQLATGIRRWKTQNGQWVQILSGGQSALVGAVFFHKAHAAQILDITAIAPYAGLGAFYFLLSAIWLTVAANRRVNAGSV